MSLRDGDGALEAVADALSVQLDLRVGPGLGVGRVEREALRLGHQLERRWLEAGERHAPVRRQRAARDPQRQAAQLDGVAVGRELEREVAKEARIVAAGEGAVIDAQRSVERGMAARAAELQVGGQRSFEPAHAAEIVEREAEVLGADGRLQGGVGGGGQRRVEVERAARGLNAVDGGAERAAVPRGVRVEAGEAQLGERQVAPGERELPGRMRERAAERRRALDDAAEVVAGARELEGGDARLGGDGEVASVQQLLEAEARLRARGEDGRAADGRGQRRARPTAAVRQVRGEVGRVEERARGRLGLG